jgi:anti-anti-sigma regulatory factor
MGAGMSEKQERIKIFVRDPLTLPSLESLRQELIDAFIRGQVVTVDMNEVSLCDTAGIQLLISASKMAKQNGIDLRFEHVSSAVAAAARKIGFFFWSPDDGCVELELR